MENDLLYDFYDWLFDDFISVTYDDLEYFDDKFFEFH